MGSNYKKSYITLEQLKNNNDDVFTLLKCLDLAVNGNYLKLGVIKAELVKLKLIKSVSKKSPKLDLEFKEEQNPSVTSLVRNYLNNRSFKLETVKIGQFSREHNRELEEATIHIGMSADEYVRSFNALALTVGKDIFFRNGAYKPETEEGRKLLAHELTHVSQNENAEEYRNISKEKLESEALAEENNEVYKSDPVIDYKVGKKIYKLKKSQIKEIERNVAHELDNWIEYQEQIMSEEEYLKLLLKYQKYKEEQQWQK